MAYRFGIVSYNRYGNFTNYGSALQSWALKTAINRIGEGRYEGVLVDYCPDCLRDKDPLNPMKNMWDKDPEARRLCEMTLPAIRVNYEKFSRFFETQFANTAPYTSENFDLCAQKERLDGFVCGSDTIFCVNEFGIDDGFYANFPCMRSRSVAYAASFGDAQFAPEDEPVLQNRLRNFRAIALRENIMLPYVRRHVAVPCARVIDPTLLLDVEDYAPITAEQQETEPYLLLYARRYNPAMEAFAEKLARENGWKVVEISLRAENAAKHRMFYEAGVEEFLSLVKHAAFVITNSYHGMIFSVQHRRPFYLFSREQCDNKIEELLSLMGLSSRLLVTGKEADFAPIDYEAVHAAIRTAREGSLAFLQHSLESLLCERGNGMLNFALGPVTSPQSVCQVGAEQVPYFRTAEFSALMLENERLVCRFVKAPENARAVFLTASGTGAMEAAVINAFTPEDKVLIVVGGGFGQRFAEICDVHGIPHTDIHLDTGRALKAEHLAAYENQGYTGLLVNMHETSTGVLYDMDLIGSFCRRNGLFLLVDAISAFLADPIAMAAWGADMVLSGSQKALACAPGVSLIVLSPKAVERVNNAKVRSLYFNLRTALKDAERGQTPFTPAVGTLRQIHQRLCEIELSGGADAEVARTAALAEDFRKKLANLPLATISESPSNACTPLHPLNASANDVFLTLKDEYNIWVCPNGGALKDTIFRVGHIGALTPADNDVLIRALRDLHARHLI